jgi:hypothetical protein
LYEKSLFGKGGWRGFKTNTEAVMVVKSPLTPLFQREGKTLYKVVSKNV